MTIEPVATSGGLVARAKNIILQPKLEWEVIDAEPATIKGVFTGYVMLLAAIPAVASLIGGVVFGYGVPGFINYRPSIPAAVIGAAVTYGLSLLSVYVLGLIINGLAPTFDGQKDPVKAFKVAAYSSTASWLAGIFGLVPMLGILGILGLYSLYLLYLGLPRLMRAPESKALSYTAVVIVVAVVLAIIAGLIVAPLRMASMTPPFGAAQTGSVSIGGHTVNTGQIEAASRNLEQAANQMAAAASATAAGTTVTGGGGGAPVALDSLTGLLPAALPGGFAKAESSSGSGGAMGMNVASSKALYRRGDSRIEIEITDLGAAGALAAMGASLGMQSNEQTADGYEKIGTVNGRMTTEKWRNAGRSGEYSVLVNNRIMVATEGSNVDMSDLKAALGAVDLGKAQSLAG